MSDLYLLGPEEPRPASDFAATVSLPFLGVGFVSSLYDFDVSAVGTCRPRSAMWFLEGASTIADDATFTTDNDRLMTVKSGANKLFDILLFNNDLSKVGEMPISEASAAFQQKGSISKDFLPELGRAFSQTCFPAMTAPQIRWDALWVWLLLDLHRMDICLARRCRHRERL